MDLRDGGERAWHSQFSDARRRKNDRLSPAMLALIVLAGAATVLMFGLLCLCAGVFLTGRLDSFRAAPSSSSAVPASAPSAPGYDSGRAAAAAAYAPLPPPPIASPYMPQPNNFYFMMGGQNQIPSGRMDEQPGREFRTPVQEQPADLSGRFASGNRRDGYSGSSSSRDGGPYPDTRFHSAAPPPAAGFGGYADASRTSGGSVLVPAARSSALRERLSRNPGVENWLMAAAPSAPARGGAGVADPEMIDVLRRLGEATFAARQYDRSARAYAELANLGTPLTEEEMLRWAKAAEMIRDFESAIGILDSAVKNNPDNVATLTALAGLLTTEKRFAEAADAYLRLATLEPRNREWRTMRAKTLAWAGKSAEAIEAGMALYKENPGDAELNQALVDMLLAAKRFDDALPVLDAMVSAAPGDKTPKERRLDALMALSRYKEAAVVCADLLAADPDNPALLLKQADILSAAGEYADAVEPFKKYLEHTPDDAAARGRLADCMMAAGLFADAAGQFETLLKAKPTDLDLKARYANALLAAKDYARAATAYMVLSEAKRDDADIAFGLVVSLRMRGPLEQAMMAADEYLRRHPNDKRMLRQAGEIAGGMKNSALAAKWLRNAVNQDPTDVDLRIELARVLAWGQKYPEAESEYRRALARRPDDVEARRGLARALFQQQKYEEALAVYGELAAGSPENAALEAEYRLYCALSSGMREEAIRQLGVLKEVEPDNVTWKADRFQALLERSRFCEAEEQADEILGQDPANNQAQSGLTNMRQYLTATPVIVTMGLNRKNSSPTPDAAANRQADLGRDSVALHGERPIGYSWRAHADLAHEAFRLRLPTEGDISAETLRLGATYYGNPNMVGRAEVGYRWLHDRRLSGQWLYDARLDFPEVGGMPLGLGVYSRRRDAYDNYQNIFDGLYATDTGMDALFRYNRWDIGGFAKATVLSDDNYGANLGASAFYRIYDRPRFSLSGGVEGEYLSWRYARPSYFSPRSYGKIGAGLRGRAYICPNPETWGDPTSYLDFAYSLYLDNQSAIGHKASLGFVHDYNTKLSVFANINFTRESYYNEFGILGGLTYKFGGCE